MDKHYLQLVFKSGIFFEYSKEPQEGFEEHEYKNKKGDTVVSYRKYYKKGIEGVLESITKYNNEDISWKQEEIVLSIVDGDDVYKVQFPLYDQRDNIQTYTESLISFLPNLEKEMKIAFRAYNFIPKDSKYTKIGVSIKVDGKKLERALTNEYKKDSKFFKGDIPMLIFEEKRGKNRPTAASVEKKNDFLYDSLIESLKSLAWEQEDVKEKTEERVDKKAVVKKEVKSKAKKKAVVADVDTTDDLPF